MYIYNYFIGNQGQICGPWGSGCSAPFCLVPPCRTPSWWVSWVWRGPKDCRKEKINGSYRSINGKWWEIAIDIYGYLCISMVHHWEMMWRRLWKWRNCCWYLYGSISAFGQRLWCSSWIFWRWFAIFHYFAIGSSRKKGESLGDLLLHPPEWWVTQVKAGNHKGFKWFK